MIELIAKIVFIASFIGIGVIIFRKMPVLVSLPISPRKDLTISFWQSVKNKIRKHPLFSGFSFQIFLQKILSKLKILALKIEAKTEKYLRSLREKSKKQKENPDDKYWQELKETKDNSEDIFKNKPG